MRERYEEDEKYIRKRKSSSFSRIIKLAVVVFIIWWVNNFTLKTTRVDITSPKVNNDINIAVLSDLHAYDGTFSIKNETILKRIRKLNPDMVCVLGDMHSSNATQEEKDISLSLMEEIVGDGYKVFFVLGEHDDRTNAYITKMREKGIKVLTDESVHLVIGKTRITIYGISNAYFAPGFDLTHEFSINKSEFNILMAHIPMYSYYADFGADLTLCGDTHGGIIQLPFIGPAYHDGRFFPELNGNSSEVYDKGLFDYDGGHMFITSGIGNNVGNIDLPVRFWNRPEVGLITISPD